MEQQTGLKLGKEYVKAVYCHPAYLTSTIKGSRWSMFKREFSVSSRAREQCPDGEDQSLSH